MFTMFLGGVYGTNASTDFGDAHMSLSTEKMSDRTAPVSPHYFYTP